MRRNGSKLKARRLGLESQYEPIVLMHKDCPVCRSEGFAARTRVELRIGRRTAIATLYQTGDGLVAVNEAGLSEAAWTTLGAEEGDEIKVSHPQPLTSLSAVRSKLYGHRLGPDELHAIIGDIVGERYSDVELATFVSAFASHRFSLNETSALTGAMVESGERIDWPAALVADKHSVGGLPGNRTTPIVVAIAAASGLMIPKTSSRAITSPAGTADTMETMTRVDLDLPTMRRVVDRVGGCLAWGGSVRLSPADDIIIRVERALDVDCEAQLVASILSKKIAAGASHVLIDMPVGPTAKVRTLSEAEILGDHLVKVGARFGLSVRPLITDGTQPVGIGMGPALEARDVLSVLRCDDRAPRDLRDRAVQLAGALLEHVGAAPAGSGLDQAAQLLDSGAAYARFFAICEAQGGFREPPVAPLRKVRGAPRSGTIVSLDNRLLARVAKLAGAPRSRSAGIELHVALGDEVAKLAGAPRSRSAGIELHVALGDEVVKGQKLITLHGESQGELAYAGEFADSRPDLLVVAP